MLDVRSGACKLHMCTFYSGCRHVCGNLMEAIGFVPFRLETTKIHPSVGHWPHRCSGAGGRESLAGLAACGCSWHATGCAFGLWRLFVAAGVRFIRLTAVSAFAQAGHLVLFV